MAITSKSLPAGTKKKQIVPAKPPAPKKGGKSVATKKRDLVSGRDYKTR